MAKQYFIFIESRGVEAAPSRYPLAEIQEKLDYYSLINYIVILRVILRLVANVIFKIVSVGTSTFWISIKVRHGILVLSLLG